MAQKMSMRIYHSIKSQGILFAALFAVAGGYLVASTFASSASLNLATAAGAATGSVNYNQSVNFNWASSMVKLPSVWTYGSPEIEVLCRQAGNTSGTLNWYAAIHLTTPSPSQSLMVGGTPSNNANGVYYYGPTWDTTQPTMCTAILEQASGPHYQYKTLTQYSFTVNP